MIIAEHSKLPMALVSLPPFQIAVLSVIRKWDPENTETSPAAYQYSYVMVEDEPVVFELPRELDPLDLDGVSDAMLQLVPQAAERFLAVEDLVRMERDDISPDQIVKPPEG